MTLTLSLAVTRPRVTKIKLSNPFKICIFRVARNRACRNHFQASVLAQNRRYFFHASMA